MRTWIADKLFDTATAPVVASFSIDGVSSSLHRKKSGSYFIHCLNDDGSESIQPVSYDGALGFLASAYGPEAQRILSDSMPDSATVTLKGGFARTLNLISSRTGKSKVEIIEELIARFGGRIDGGSQQRS